MSRTSSRCCGCSTRTGWPPGWRGWPQPTPLAERLLNYENCYGEGITEALEKAQDVHLAACEAGTPDPEALAQRLATGALESGWGVFRDGPAKYAPVLGAAGLARYRELLTNAPARRYSGT